MADSPLKVELETYERLLPDLLPDQGKYAVIFATTLVGVYNDYEDALRAGYGAAKLKSFLVKRIEQIESAQQFSRDISCLT